ncbi:MAG: FAD-binding protein [candidate division Zixibacteria bacterium]|nr:FAD-binding protein [candidate division Zixibacteria bacterium]
MPPPSFGTLDQTDLTALRSICGADFVLTDSPDLAIYGADETEDLCFPPEVVVRPQTAVQVQAIMRYCSARRLPVTPRGAGTGLSGGALPVHAGVCLSLERMNKILEVDTNNLVAVVQPGVITQMLQEVVEAQGLMYPPDPASRGSCMLGGNLAECAGGPRALKYGVTKDYVLGVEAVLPNGDRIRWGGKLLKNVTGYNLAQILVGSEGTLAIVTEITLKLVPLPKHRMMVVAPFDDGEKAATALTKIFMARLTPSAAEYLEGAAVRCAEAKFGKSFPQSDADAHLLLELDGNDRTLLERDAEAVGEICLAEGARDVLLADERAKMDDLWQMRRGISEAVKSVSIYKEEDTVVPRARLPELVRIVRDICARHRLSAITYGHAGDGNLHVNILKRDLSDQEWDERLPGAITELFEKVVAMGGAISGEHGIGWVQKRYMPIALGPAELALMRGLKGAFDPDGILNPGKMFPDEAP